MSSLNKGYRTVNNKEGEGTVMNCEEIKNDPASP